MSEVLKITKYKNMKSGRNFCALVENVGKKTTGFGKTKEEAIVEAKQNL